MSKNLLNVSNNCRLFFIAAAKLLPSEYTSNTALAMFIIAG
jgi:hypothetical protein